MVADQAVYPQTPADISAQDHERPGAYRPEIDGLRAVAVCGVILFHTGLGLASGGYVGVDVFFVISGYLITSIITREIGGGAFTLLGFYERRIRRIFPALFVVLACSEAAALVILTPGELRTFSESLVATGAFLSNVFFWLKSGYFGGDAERFPLIHMWSLSVEEQYYVVFPGLMLLFAGRRLILNLVLVAGFASSLAACIYTTRDHQMAAFFLTPMRAWELLAGVLVSVNQASWCAPLIARPRVATALELVGAAAVVAPIFLYDSSTAFPGVAAIAPVAGTAVIILVSSQSSALGRVLASKPFVGVGLISYSAYLWHQPLFAFARAEGLTNVGAVVYVALTIATFALAYLSWRFVERPFRRRDLVGRTRIFAGAGVLTAMLVAAGLLGHIADGFPGRFDRATLALNATSAPSPKRDACHTEGLAYLHPAQACRYFGGPVRWAVLGDSHGVEIAYALAEQLRPANQSVLHLTFSGCQAALTFQSPNPGCSAWTREAAAYLEADRDITGVVVVFRHSFYLFGDQTKTYPRPPDMAPNFLPGVPREQARAIYLASFTELVRRLSVAGKKVYVVEPIPDLPTNVDHYIFTSSRPGMRGQPTGVDLQYYRARNRLILTALQKLKALPNVTLLDPVPTVCDQRRCASIIGGKSMYFDDNHFSLEGARRFITEQRASGALPLAVVQAPPHGR